MHTVKQSNVGGMACSGASFVSAAAAAAALSVKGKGSALEPATSLLKSNPIRAMRCEMLSSVFKSRLCFWSLFWMRVHLKRAYVNIKKAYTQDVSQKTNGATRMPMHSNKELNKTDLVGLALHPHALLLLNCESPV